MNRRNWINIFLTLTTIVIWGWVLKKYFFKANTRSFVASDHPRPNTESIPASSFTYELLNNYGDPFRIVYVKDSSRKGSKDSLQQSKEFLNRKPQLSNVPISTSNISYKGIIQTDNKLTAVILQNGVMSLLSTNDKIGVFIISKIYKDSLMLLYEKKKYVLLKL